MTTFCAIGECMIELTHGDAGSLNMGFAGDSLNATTYFCREKAPSTQAYYMTALGDDAYSEQMLEAWRIEGIETNYVPLISGELPGLSIVENDASGERRFYYWRQNSAFKQLFSRSPELFAVIKTFDVVYLSGITLAVVPEPERETLCETIREAHDAGVQIVFDPNYRERLWDNAASALKWIEPLLPVCDFFLVSNEDIQSLYGDQDPVQTVVNLRTAGVGEIVVRRGREPCLVDDGQSQNWVDACKADQVDATGAGDSFNGTYLAHRLAGKTALQAAERAHQVAARVIAHRGAIIPR